MSKLLTNPRMMRSRILIVAILFTMPLLAACTAGAKEGTAIETVPEEVNLQAFEDGTYFVDPGVSTLYWEGYRPIGGHMGGISLKSGELIVKNGQPNKGTFVIDMTSITNEDIGESKKKGFLNHLASDDFFSVADFPTARYDITRISPYDGEGDFNYKIEGDLTIRAITKPVQILARIRAEEGQISAQGNVLVDRTEFDITIRSASFFEELGDRLIKDEFLLELDLVAKKLET